MSSQTDQPSIVLVRPQMGENIGGAARAMWNFGLDRMRVVAPRDGWPSPKAAAMASGAGRLLDEARLFDDLPAALADCTHVFATTARMRGLTKPVMSPEAAMSEARRMIGEGGRVAVIFGPERAGLENEDVALANTLITVPVNPAYASLNLAQCVLLLSYEWMRQGGAVEGARVEMAGGKWAEQAEIEALARHYEDRMEEAGFFFPPEKAASMRLNLRNLWSRMPLTQADVRMLHGVLRQIIRWKTRDE